MKAKLAFDLSFVSRLNRAVPWPSLGISPRFSASRVGLSSFLFDRTSTLLQIESGGQSPFAARIRPDSSVAVVLAVTPHINELKVCGLAGTFGVVGSPRLYQDRCRISFPTPATFCAAWAPSERRRSWDLSS